MSRATLSTFAAFGDAPQIDGAVFVSSRRPLRADAYDLHGTAVGF
jgi:hypothetical protein